MQPVDLAKLASAPLIAALAGVELNTVLVLAGALVLGAVALRSQAMKLIREDRDEQRRGREAAEARLTLLEAEPNVEKLWELMKHHDERSREAGEQQLEALKEVAASLRANTEALRLWATTKAQDFGG